MSEIDPRLLIAIGFIPMVFRFLGPSLMVMEYTRPNYHSNATAIALSIDIEFRFLTFDSRMPITGSSALCCWLALPSEKSEFWPPPTLQQPYQCGPPFDFLWHVCYTVQGIGSFSRAYGG
jgi:hypothetical protein